MSYRGTVAVLCVLGWVVPSVQAQVGRPGTAGTRAMAAVRNRQAPLRPALRGITPGDRALLGTFESNRYRGIYTRLEQIRRIRAAGFGQEYRDEVDLLTALETPVERLLERRNLLAARSVLAQRTVAMAGKMNYVKDEDGKPRGDVSRLPDPTPPPDFNPDGLIGRSYCDNQSAKLRQRSAEYFEMGAASYRERQLIKARDYFELVLSLEPERAATYVALALVHYGTRNFQQASAYFYLAMRRARTLDDLRLDRTRFFANDQEFQRAFDVINVMARTRSESAGPQLLLAYMCWLNGDLAAALSTLDTAASISGLSDAAQTDIRKLRSFLHSQGSSPAQN